jgi:hypothetical protein
MTTVSILSDIVRYNGGGKKFKKKLKNSAFQLSMNRQSI